MCDIYLFFATVEKSRQPDNVIDVIDNVVVVDYDVVPRITLQKVQPLQWRHNESNGVSIHWHRDGLLKRLLRRLSKKSPKLLVTGLCEGNPSVTGGFPS